jgi:hypothetical protein
LGLSLSVFIAGLSLYELYCAFDHAGGSEGLMTCVSLSRGKKYTHGGCMALALVVTRGGPCTEVAVDVKKYTHGGCMALALVVTRGGHCIEVAVDVDTCRRLAAEKTWRGVSSRSASRGAE